MKKIRSAVRIICLLMIIAFLGTGGWIAYTVYNQGGRWITSSMNSRIRTARQTTGMGSITDRQGQVLAYTDSDGQRHYAQDKATRLAMSQTVGDQMSMSGTGVETFHAGTLLDLSGSIVDRVWQMFNGQQRQGDNIRLTADARLSAYIAQQFPQGKEGAVCVINYETGEILSMVSKPHYDPEDLANRQAAGDQSGTGYLNRCLQGLYTPGSVFKIVTLASALEYIPGVEDMIFRCDGPRSFGNGQVSCYGDEIHGEITLKQAFAQSCNVTFASIAKALGPERLLATAQKMGFNDNFSFRDLVLYDSVMPRDIKDESELAWTGDGQGRLLVTPLHMALISASVANEGVMPTPQLIAQVTGSTGIPRLRTLPAPYGQVISPAAADTIKEYMLAVVQSGTGTRARIKGYTVCGKTGSAETSDDKTVPTNAWFTGFVDDKDHPYAIAVVVEQGGTGGSVAAPLAAKALKKAIELDIR